MNTLKCHQFFCEEISLDEDDPLRRIADRLGNEDVEGEDAVAEEKPLNSKDDQSNDEDLTSLFDANNVAMCQFEKVNRARTKWKFQLKDGIMHIDKKDYGRRNYEVNKFDFKDVLLREVW